MIGVSKLYLGQTEASDTLRYGWREGQRSGPSSHAARKPVVVWNVTSRCNLSCQHCYADAAGGRNEKELTAEEAGDLIDDLADFGCPVLLFSGGEPLTRPDLADLVHRAVSRGMRAVISTNGTLMTPERAAELKAAGASYAGVSLDGLKETHDRFRNRPGAFEQALEGIRACHAASLHVGLRLTLTRLNAGELDGIFDLLVRERVPRVCFYHLVYTGRGSAIRGLDLSHEETRRAVDHIIDRARDAHENGIRLEVLTVDNHCDGPYLYLRMRREGDPRADEVLDLLRANGGNASGSGIGCVGWDGSVFPDQFWRNHPLGNVREQPFSRIWSDRRNIWLAWLRDRRAFLDPPCPACRFFDACGGNFRARAEAAGGHAWAVDPACYLTEEERRE